MPVPPTLVIIQLVVYIPLLFAMTTILALRMIVIPTVVANFLPFPVMTKIHALLIPVIMRLVAATPLTVAKIIMNVQMKLVLNLLVDVYQL